MTAPRPADRAPLAGQQVAPAPQDVPLIQKVAAVLLAGYATEKTVKALLGLLSGFGIGAQAIRAALGLAKSAHMPRPILAALGIERRSAAADIARAAAHADVYFRAAYLTKAANRLQRDLDAGANLRDALRREVANFEAHKAARQKRLEAAGQAASSAELYGTLLGWYRNPLLDSDTDCIVADGHNFDAAQGTIIGWPGAVHPKCGCHAGPPHEGAGMVNDVLGDVLGRMSPSAAPGQVLKLRRRAG